jgi:hypothetical protein
LGLAHRQVLGGATPCGRCAVLLAAALALIALAGITANPAAAAGGNYVIAGGTAYEQAQVRQALDASSFDWSVVPTQVTIHIARGIPVSYSIPGQTWLDANLLDSGTFSWGVVQMEYAQQVQLTAIDAPMHAELTGLLGAQQWCYDNPALPSGANACERFAATLAWAYWPSPDNSMKPVTSSDWSASMNPQAFRTLLSQLLGVPEALDTRAVRDLETQKPASGALPSHPTVSSPRRARR